MKRSITSILIALLLISISCTSQKNSSGKNLSVDYKIQSSYLLIPVEEKAPEIKISVSASNPTHQYAFDVHLAVDKIDYWVPLDVKELKDQNLTLSFLGVNESILGMEVTRKEDSSENFEVKLVEERPLNDIRYYYLPLPYDELQKNPNLKNNKGW